MLSKKLRQAFESWNSFWKSLGKLTLAELYQMLEHESMTLRRKAYINRLITRITTLETERIRKKLEAKYL